MQTELPPSLFDGASCSADAPPRKRRQNDEPIVPSVTGASAVLDTPLRPCRFRGAMWDGRSTDLFYCDRRTTIQKSIVRASNAFWNAAARSAAGGYIHTALISIFTFFASAP